MFLGTNSVKETLSAINLGSPLVLTAILTPLFLPSETVDLLH